MTDTHIGVKLRRLNNALFRHLQNSEAHREIESITGTNGYIISYLATHRDNPVYQKDLEDAFGITRSTASKVISLMEKKGLVERKPVPTDARLKQLTLTPLAETLDRQMRRDAEKTEALLTKSFSEEELATLRSYLERMSQNLKSGKDRERL